MSRASLMFAMLFAGVMAWPSSVAAQADSTAGFRILVDKVGVSGFETEVREALRAALPSFAKSRVDESGNLIATVGSGKPHTLFMATMDEDGYFVSAITDDGYLRVHRVTNGVTSRLFDQMHVGQPMWIRTQDGKHVAGVFVTPSAHLQRGREQAPAPKGLDDLWVDVGADSSAAVDKLGIRMLDTVSLRERSQALAHNRLAGVAAQARAADFALLAALEGLDPESVKGTLTFAWVAQGSFGDRGTARLALQFQDVDRVFVVGRTPMPRQGASPKGAIGQLGGGVLLADTDAKTLEQLKAQGIPTQSVAGVLRAPNSLPAPKTTLLGLPVVFAQTPVECVDAADVASLSRAIISLAVARPRTSASAGSGKGSGTGESQPPLIGVLRPLIAASAVSGAEGPVRDIILKHLPKWAKPQTDERGNVTVSFGQGGKELLFVAHMDEVGYDIVDLLDDGNATVRRRGGAVDMLWEAHPVFVQTSKGAVPAVFAPRPNYLTASAAAPRADEMVLHFGTNSRAETEALGVAKGNTATIRKELTKLAGSRWTARSMDDRCGVTALLAALDRIVDPAKVPNRVTFAFVVGEETGLAGSGFLAERAHPAAVFAIDTFVSSDSPVDPQRLALVPLGSGVVARAIDSSSMTPPETVARVVAVGRAHKIPVTPSATSGGNDGSQFSRYGSIVVPLSWPGRYSHSPVEVMDLRDLENLAGLIGALVHEF